MTGEYILFPSAHGTFTKTNNMLGHKTSLDKFQNTEIVQNIFSGHNRIELKINNNIITGKPPNT